MRQTVFRGRGGPPYIGWAQTIAGVGEDPSRELQKVEANVFGILDVDADIKDLDQGRFPNSMSALKFSPEELQLDEVRVGAKANLVPQGATKLRFSEQEEGPNHTELVGGER